MKTLPVLALLLALTACPRQSPPPPPPAPGPGVPTPPSADKYSIALTGSGPWAAGKEASAVITVTAKAGYHVNPEYPMAFRAEGHAGVRFAEDRVKLVWGPKTPCPAKAEDACAVEVPLALTPEKSGAAVVAGIVAFSVCNPEHCLIEKVPLSLPIDVL